MAAVSVLVGAGVAALVLPAVMLAYTTGNAVLTSGMDRAGAQRRARDVIGLLDQELRAAGLDPSGALGALGHPPILVADRHVLEFVGDVDGDGVSDLVRYEFDPFRRRLTRTRASWLGAAFATPGTAGPVPTAVRSLDFAFLDDSGPPEILLIPLPLSSAVRARVKRIVFSVQAQASATDGAAAATLTSSVRPRNL
jgi:hypothetical protein